jgi:cytoskeletal protein RodZ
MGVAEAVEGSHILIDKRADGSEAPSEPKVQPPLAADAQSLGFYLLSVRERRGSSLEEIVSQARVPRHYVSMIESNDYSGISDQLYVLPFLRRYALFLGLDPEDIASRFVREVQRADGAPLARAIEPYEMDRVVERKWIKPALLVGGLILVMIAAWVVQSKHYHHSMAQRVDSSDVTTSAVPH